LGQSDSYATPVARVAEPRNATRISRKQHPQGPDEDPTSHGPLCRHTDATGTCRRRKSTAVDQQSQGLVLRHICSGPQGHAEKARAIVAAVAVPLQRVWPRVERGGGEAVLVDVGKRPARPAVADLQEIRVRGVAAECGEENEGVEAGTVMVYLTFDPLELASVL
jgi:hypothetical protein